MFLSAHKILAHPDRIADWFSDRDATPINVQLCPYDGACNHACPACVSTHKGFTGSILEVERIDELLTEFEEMGILSVTLTGGSEPLLHPDFDELLTVVARHRLEAALITNGSRIDRERARALVRTLRWVRVSLDGASPAGFRHTHGLGPEAFHEVEQGVRRLVRAKREALREGCDLAGLATLGLAFLTVPSERCIADVMPAVDRGAELGVDYVQFRPMLRPPGHGAETPITGALDRRLVAELDRAVASSSPALRVIRSERKYEQIRRGRIERPERCHFVQFAPAISASGNVSLCCHHMESDSFLIGNIREAPFREIWFSERKRSCVKNLRLQACPALCRGQDANALLDQLRTTPHRSFV